jgi:hypothetical protein
MGPLVLFLGIFHQIAPKPKATPAPWDEVQGALPGWASEGPEGLFSNLVTIQSEQTVAIDIHSEPVFPTVDE